MPSCLLLLTTLHLGRGDFSASRNGIAFDANAGRYFRHCVDEAVAALPEQLRVLRDEGASAASRSIEAARKVRKPKEALDIDAPRRLKGQAFVAQQKLLEKVKAGELDKKYVLTIRQAEEVSFFPLPEPSLQLTDDVLERHLTARHRKQRSLSSQWAQSVTRTIRGN